MGTLLFTERLKSNETTWKDLWSTFRQFRDRTDIQTVYNCWRTTMILKTCRTEIYLKKWAPIITTDITFKETREITMVSNLRLKREQLLSF